MINYEEKIGAHIKEVRMAKGLSQSKLATACDMSSSQLSSYENSSKIPNLNTTAKIAKALGVSIERLYYGDDSISFINAAPDQGRKIVNCIYELWKMEVVDYHEYFMPGGFPAMNYENNEQNGMFLMIHRHAGSIKRLINSLNEYKLKKDTYPEPEKYLEILLASVATEINNEIESIKNKRKCLRK